MPPTARHLRPDTKKVPPTPLELIGVGIAVLILIGGMYLGYILS